jgi:hypothetical protein
VKCAELMPLLNAGVCSETVDGAQIETQCLYPSSDPVVVYISELLNGFRVHDGGGAMRSAIVHGRNWQDALKKAGKRHSVEVKGDALWATAPTVDWLYPAILAVSNASALAARLSLEAAVSRAESTLREVIYEKLLRAVPESKIGKDFEYRGRSGHMWAVDFAVREESLILVKSVVQNGNSINSNYAAFGDIGDQEEVAKFSVYDRELNQDAEALIRQVAALVPVKSLTPMVQQRAYRSRLS